MSNNKKSPSQLPLSIDPVYRMSDVNQDIDLDKLDISIRKNSSEYKIKECQISLNWLPRPKITVTGMTDDRRFIDILQKQASFEAHLPYYNESFQLFIHDSARGRDTRFSGRAEDLVLGRQESNIKYLIFHLVNFVIFEGEWIKDKNEKFWAGRVELEDEDYKITLDRSKDFVDDAEKSLSSQSGYFITHVGKIEKKHNENILAEEIPEILECLEYFFSFSKGAWCGVILSTGFDAQDNVVYKNYIVPHIDQYRFTISWFNRTSDSLKKLFPGFRKAWKDPVLEKILKMAIHWFVEVSKMSIGIEGSIAIQQIALEMISWHEMVERKNKYTRKDFESSCFNAEKKIRVLLEALNIPTSIPPNLQLVKNLVANDNVLTDGLSLIIWYRNGLIHGSPKGISRVASLTSEEKQEVWKLGKWYLDLTLLALFEFDGYYWNATEPQHSRGKEGELVPWHLPLSSSTGLGSSGRGDLSERVDELLWSES